MMRKCIILPDREAWGRERGTKQDQVDLQLQNEAGLPLLLWLLLASDETRFLADVNLKSLVND